MFLAVHLIGHWTLTVAALCTTLERSISFLLAFLGVKGTHAVSVGIVGKPASQTQDHLDRMKICIITSRMETREKNKTPSQQTRFSREAFSPQRKSHVDAAPPNAKLGPRLSVEHQP